MCTHLAMGTSCRCCVVTGDCCRHTHSGGSQGHHQEPGPTAGTLIAVKALATSVHSCGYKVSPWACAQHWRPMTEVGPAGCRDIAKEANSGEPIGAGDRVGSELTSSYGGPGYGRALLFLQDLPTSVHIALLAGDRGEPGACRCTARRTSGR